MEAEYGLHLQPRLQAIASLVPPGARLADIGTDHGYLPIWLLRRGKIASAVATDIGEAPLDHARCSAQIYGVQLDCRLCDGLSAVSPEEADTVVVAGMGGETILHIVNNAPWTREGTNLLLQPMSKAEVLRRWIAQNGYVIRQERLVEDKGILYPILWVMGGHAPPLTPGQIWAGVGTEDPLYSQYAGRQLAKLRRAVEGLRKASRQEPDRLMELEAAIHSLEEGGIG